MIFALLLFFQLDSGALAMREGRFTDAVRIYRERVRQAPEDARLRLNLGLALHSAKQYEAALPELRRYLKAFPKPGPVHLVLGAAQLKLGKPCDAIAPLEQAMRWQPSPEATLEMADAYAGCQRPADAAPLYAKLAPRDPKYARAAARAWWRARDYDKAQPLYAAVESRFATDPEFQYEYGDTLARKEGAEAGLDWLRKAVEAEPGMIAARGALGRALMELNRAAEALPHLESAAPADDTLLLPLSRAYRAAGRTAEAARTEAQYKQRVARQN